MPDPHLSTHRLKATLLDVTPPVWRELRLPSQVTLRVLHELFQVAFGWEDRHLHEWQIRGVTYALPDEDSWGEEIADESAFLLGDVTEEDDSFTYLYDFGDGWEHLVEVLAVEPFDATVAPVSCLDGARSAPPEDCGGPSGYEHLLDALADPDDAEHEEMLIWAGEGFDPEFFDRDAVDQRLEPYWRPWEEP